MSTHFSHPDIPYVENRVLYDYLFLLGQLLRSITVSINKIENDIDNINSKLSEI